MPISLSGSLNLSGSLTTTGTITATTLVVQTITSSISSITGSTNFGSVIGNTHNFTGSLNVTGSLAVVTTGTEFQVTNTGVNIGNALTDSHVISGSLRINPSTLIVSSSGNVGIGTSPNSTAGITELAIGSSNTNPLISGIRDGVSAFSLSSDSVGTLLNERRNLDLRFSSNNTERMRISAAGTASFTANTLASAGDAATITLKQNSTTANTGIYLERSGEQKGYYIYMGGSADSLTFQRNNAGTKGDVMALTRDGVVELFLGQLKFPATQNPSSDANTLDDYEEGTWTPTWSSTGGTITTVSAFTSGTYTKIGNVVHVWARLYTNSVSSPTGEVTVSGLPFTVGSQVGNKAMHLFTMNAITGTLTGTPTISFNNSNTTATIYNKIWNSTEFGGDIATYFDNDTWGYFYGTYLV